MENTPSKQQQGIKLIAGLKVLHELYVWAKYSLILCGIFAVISFVRVNFLGAELQLSTASTPIMMIPNAVITDPTPLPRRK